MIPVNCVLASVPVRHGLRGLAIAMVFALLLPAGASVAAESDLKTGARQAGRTAGSAVHEIGHGAKQAGKEIGRAAKSAGKSVGAAAREGGREFRQAVHGDKR